MTYGGSDRETMNVNRPFSLPCGFRRRWFAHASDQPGNSPLKAGHFRVTFNARARRRKDARRISALRTPGGCEHLSFGQFRFLTLAAWRLCACALNSVLAAAVVGARLREGRRGKPAASLRQTPFELAATVKDDCGARAVKHRRSPRRVSLTNC